MSCIKIRSRQHIHQDHIYNIRALSNRRLDKNKEFYLACINLKAAFHKLQRNYMEKAMNELGVSPKLKTLIMNLNTRSTRVVRLNREQSSVFKWERGTRQGDNLSPLFFVICMKVINTLCRTVIRNTCLGNLNLEAVVTQHLLHLTAYYSYQQVKGSCR